MEFFAGLGFAILFFLGWKFLKERRQPPSPDVERFWAGLSPPDRVLCELDPALRAQTFAKWREQEKERELTAEIAAFLDEGERRVYEQSRKELERTLEELRQRPDAPLQVFKEQLRDTRARRDEALETVHELAMATYPAALVARVSAR